MALAVPTMDKRREDLLSTLSRAERLAGDLRLDIENDAQFRKTLVDASQLVLRRVQTSTERTWDILLQPNLLMALRVALDAGWLGAIATAQKTGVTAGELAGYSGADPSLVVQLMTLLSAAAIVREVGLTTYAANEMTRLMTVPGVRDGIRHYSDDSARTVVAMPAYLENNGYCLPPDAINSIFTYAHGTPFFKLLAHQPGRQRCYESCMAASKPSKTVWIDVYPVERLKVSSGEDVLLVDLGGGTGQELADFHARRLTLKLPGILVLQDRAEVLDAMVPEGWQHGFHAVPHDFLTPQPPHCLRARAYYLRMTLRELPDAAAATVLRHVRAAMRPGYSTLFVDDVVLPNEGCAFADAAFAVSLLAILSGKERRKWEWEKLVAAVEGLRIEKIWPLGDGLESLIEIVRIA